MNPDRQKESIVIAGYYGFGNAGDELILVSLIQQLRKPAPGVQITVLSAHPDETARQLHVHAVNRWHPWQWIRVFWKADRFLLGGGGLLQESTGPWNSSYYLMLLAIAKCLGCRTEVRAIGVDPITRGWNRFLTRLVFNLCVDSASIRDADSQRSLEEVGVRHRLWRVPDLIFNLELPAVLPALKDSPRIAWALTSWPQRPGWEHDLAHLLDRVAEQLHVTHDLLVFFPAQDEALAHKISGLTTSTTRIRMGSPPEDLITWIRECGLMVGMRYHALALAARAEKPFIGWGIQRKVRTLCHDFNQPLWMFERGWDTDALLRQICEAWRHRDTLPERYRKQLSHLLTTAPIASESARIFVSQA